jgi:hypothetical protein
MSEKLTTDRVTDIVGRLSAERIVQILDTGATENELLEAKIMAGQDDIEGAPRSDDRVEMVHALYDILRADLIEREAQ